MDSTNTEMATDGQHSTAAQQEILDTKIFGIAGITSERSIKTIESAFGKTPGVKSVNIDREKGTVTVTFNVRQTNMAELHELLLRSGYRPPVSIAPKV
jgi:copper chaperone CopZ